MTPPDISIVSLHVWRGGVLRSQPDDVVLRAARAADLTLVTYDGRTIAPLVAEWSFRAEDHAGVIFIDSKTIYQNDIGGQVAALIAHRDTTNAWEWGNMVVYLRPVAPP